MMNQNDNIFYKKTIPLYDVRFETHRKDDVLFYVQEAKKAKGKVLEAGCGTGRVLLRCMKAGVDITGLDGSPDMLRVLKHKAKEQGLKPNIHEGDFCTFRLNNRFALIIIPFRPFLHLLTVHDQLTALNNFHRHLKPGGRLILDVFNPNLRLIASGGKRRRIGKAINIPEGIITAWSHPKYDLANQWIIDDHVVELRNRKGKLLKRTRGMLHVRYLFRFEAEHLFARAGFTVEKLYGDFHRNPFTSNSKDMVWVLKKI